MPTIAGRSVRVTQDCHHAQAEAQAMATDRVEFPEPMRHGVTGRGGRVAALVAGAVVLALMVATGYYGRAAHLTSVVGLGAVALGVSCLVVGVLLAARRPDNAMGWCLLAGAFFLACTGLGGTVSVLDYRLHHDIPLGGLAVVLQPSWAPAIVFVGLSFLLFPDGHFSSRPVKWATWVVLAVGILWMGGAFGIAIQAVLTHAVHLDRTGNLLEVDDPRGAWAWWGAVQMIFFLVVGTSWLLWLVLQATRYRRAGDEERHQMKWLLSGAVVSLVCGALAFTDSGTGWLAGLGISGLVALPVSIAVGATKFHLYAIDRLISRTLAYVLLTGVVVGVYVGVVTLATTVIGFSSPVGVATSTLVAATLFNPVRKRLQRSLDRRFNRAHYDAERTVIAFAARLRESVDPGSVSEDLMGVVHAVFQPARAVVWVRREPGGAREGLPVAASAVE
jgi:hypothetical protein